MPRQFSASQNLPTKAQKWGTCSFANPKAAILGILYTLKLERLTAAQKKTRPAGAEILSAMDAAQLKAFKEQAFEYAKQEYKKFTNFLRNVEVDEIIKNYQSDKVTPQRKKIAYDLLLEYLVAHHGQVKKDNANPRTAKRKNEVERVERIFKALNETDRKKLLQDLGARSVMLYETAKTARDTGYQDLLENRWPISTTAVLSQRDKEGCTPLMRAILQFDSPKMVAEFLNFQNASDWINTKDNHGNTALHLAIIKNNKRMIELITSHPDIDLTVTDKAGNTPFALAAIKSNSDAMLIISNAQEKQKEARAAKLSKW